MEQAEKFRPTTYDLDHSSSLHEYTEADQEGCVVVSIKSEAAQLSSHNMRKYF